ncbi:MAG: hypothetical protein EZS28_008437 [Streblomastix strix]|uniref:Uncharacterized protein n=1 Tax=Streblomastix strix TaxID=222440 RepID=A0A5J4WNP3_9EUKA|nr:MAG: hypothetical protein EZS28_008437 [Streblomastix strix]
MRLTSFYESQIQRNITEQNNNTIHIDTSWDFGSGTGEQLDKFQEDFMNKSKYLEIRPLDKNNKKLKYRKHYRSWKMQRNNQAQAQWYYNNQVLDSLLGPLFSQTNHPRQPRKATKQSHTKLRSRQPTNRKQWIARLTQTNPWSQTTPYQNQNQSSILNVDIKGIITNLFSIPKVIQHQQIAGEAALGSHAPRESFSINGNVRRVTSSTDCKASGQVGVAGTKLINIQKTPSTQLQGNPIRESKNQSEDQQRRQPGASPWTVPTNENSKQNKGGDSYTGNFSYDPNGRNISTLTKHRNGMEISSLSVYMKICKESGIHTKRVFLSIQKRGQREEIVREIEDLSVLGLKRRRNSIHIEVEGRIKRKLN